MKLQIFDVEHGACALLTTDDGKHIMIDCGHNSDTGWNPGDYLRSIGVGHLDMLVITNYDEDHASGLPNLLKRVTVTQLVRNQSVTPDTLQTLKSEDGMGAGIERLAQMMRDYAELGPLLTFAGVETELFYHSYPTYDDENNLSVVLKLTINGVVFIFPGDLEKAGWKALLENDASFRQAVMACNVLVAAHHGRENGYYPELFTKYGCNPYWIVISDKGYQHETQETVQAYKQHAKGFEFRGEKRWVLTTRNDGHITFWFANGQWGVGDDAPAPRKYNLI